MVLCICDLKHKIFIQNIAVFDHLRASCFMDAKKGDWMLLQDKTKNSTGIAFVNRAFLRLVSRNAVQEVRPEHGV